MNKHYQNIMLNILVKGQNSADMLNELKRSIPFVDFISDLWEPGRHMLVIFSSVHPLHMKNGIANNTQKFVCEVGADL